MQTNRKRLSTIGIIIQNLRKQVIRNSMMLVLVIILTFAIFSSSLLIASLKLGITNTSNRLGADIVVVPKDYVSSVQDALFQGKPSTVYFSSDWIDKIKSVVGVKRASYQMYLATLSDSECCDNELQIIAFDPATDFVIQPWIKKNTGVSLSQNQIIIGNNLGYKAGDTAKFYGEEFKVAAKLDKTGMGYDNSVFLNYDTAYDLAQKPVVGNYFTIGSRKDIISMITIEVEDKNAKSDVAKNIVKQFGTAEIAVYESSSLLNGLFINMKEYAVYSGILNNLLLVSTLFSLLSIFSITMNERRREFGIYRFLGANRRKLILFIVWESEIICIAGCFLGTLLAGILIVTFQNYIALLLKVPFLLPGFDIIRLLLGKVLILSVLSGLLSSLYSAIRFSLAEEYYLLRSNEL